MRKGLWTFSALQGVTFVTSGFTDGGREEAANASHYFVRSRSLYGLHRLTTLPAPLVSVFYSSQPIMFPVMGEAAGMLIRSAFTTSYRSQTRRPADSRRLTSTLTWGVPK